MDLLYRVGGLSGTEIGEMMGVDYSCHVGFRSSTQPT